MRVSKVNVALIREEVFVSGTVRKNSTSSMKGYMKEDYGQVRQEGSSMVMKIAACRGGLIP